MKRLIAFAFVGAWLSTAQAQQPVPATTTTPSSTTVSTGGQSPAQTAPRKTNLKERQRRQHLEDRRPTGDPNPHRFRRDSLRRGGATDVDTLRR